MSDAPENDDLRAGEYALGLGEPAERRAFETEFGTDAALAGAVAGWEQRLAPLALGFAPAEPPPGLWPRIERSVFGGDALASVTPTPRGSGRPRGVWAGRLGAGAIGFALAAGIAVVVTLERTPLAVVASPVVPIAAVPVAALLPKTAGAPVIVALREPDGRLIIRPVGSLTAPAGKDYELWSLPANAKAPIALGLLRGDQAVVTASAGQILVSLETSGGSPTGAPQGPVLWGGAYGGG